MIIDFLSIFKLGLTTDEALLFWFLVRFIIYDGIKYLLKNINSLGGKL